MSLINVGKGSSERPEELSGEATDSGVDLVDADQVIVNDSGVMKQVGLTKLWSWVQSKSAGAVASILTSKLTANRALLSSSAGNVSVSNVTNTELGYLDGVTSNIQNQLNAKPTIKCKILKGVFPGTSANFTKAHGIPDGSTVLGFCMGVQYSGAADVTSRLAMPPNFTDSANFHYQVYIADGDLTVRQISSSSLRGMPYKCVIWYD